MSHRLQEQEDALNIAVTAAADALRIETLGYAGRSEDDTLVLLAERAAPAAAARRAAALQLLEQAGALLREQASVWASWTAAVAARLTQLAAVQAAHREQTMLQGASAKAAVRECRAVFDDGDASREAALAHAVLAVTQARAGGLAGGACCSLARHNGCM
jgi:hypothetical protein